MNESECILQGLKLCGRRREDYCLRVRRVVCRGQKEGSKRNAWYAATKSGNMQSVPKYTGQEKSGRGDRSPSENTVAPRLCVLHEEGAVETVAEEVKNENNNFKTPPKGQHHRDLRW